MPKINLFLDSSAFIAGIISSEGASRVLLLLAESDQISLAISEQVLIETEHAIARKIPKALPELRKAIIASKARIIRDPSPEEVKMNLDLMSHPADIPILLAAMKDKTDYLVTLNRKHFLDDPQVASRSTLRIGTPGDALSWVRNQLFGHVRVEDSI